MARWEDRVARELRALQLHRRRPLPIPPPWLADVQQSVTALQDIVSMLGPIGTDTVSAGGGGSDISPLSADGVPSLSPRTVATHYFDWHHTETDTVDKVDPVEFRKNAAMLSVVTYVLADMDGRLAGRKGAGE